MSDVQAQVSLPANSQALADALSKFAVAVLAAHKAGGGLAVELTADVGAAVAALAPALGALSGLGAESQAEPLGVAEAFALAGFQVVRSLSGK